MGIIEELRGWWPVISVFATLGSVIAMLAAGWCLYQLNKRFVNRLAHEAMKEVQADHGDRLDALERRMATVPDSKSMHLLQLAIEEIRGDLKALNAKTDGSHQVMEALKENLGLLVQSHLQGQSHA